MKLEITIDEVETFLELLAEKAQDDVLDHFDSMTYQKLLKFQSDYWGYEALEKEIDDKI